MRIKRTTRIKLEDGREILLSYGTAVAMRHADGSYVVYSKRYSPTSTRHVDNFVGANGIRTVGLAEWTEALRPYVFVDADKNSATE